MIQNLECGYEEAFLKSWGRRMKSAFRWVTVNSRVSDKRRYASHMVQKREARYQSFNVRLTGEMLGVPSWPRWAEGCTISQVRIELECLMNAGKGSNSRMKLHMLVFNLKARDIMSRHYYYAMEK